MAVATFVAVVLQRGDELFLHRETDTLEVSGVLRLGVDADRSGCGAAELPGESGALLLNRLDQRENFFERGDLELAVETGV